MFLKKKDRAKRICVDYRKLKDITIKAKCSISIIEDLFDPLRNTAISNKLDLISAYHQVPIYENDKFKTAFVTHAGQYQWNVMPFGLINAPATFQRLMNHFLRAYIGRFCVVYLNGKVKRLAISSATIVSDHIFRPLSNFISTVFFNNTNKKSNDKDANSLASKNKCFYYSRLDHHGKCNVF